MVGDYSPHGRREAESRAAHNPEDRNHIGGSRKCYPQRSGTQGYALTSSDQLAWQSIMSNLSENTCFTSFLEVSIKLC